MASSYVRTSDSGAFSVTATISSRLPADIAGRIVRPGDPDYDATRQILSGAYDRRPAAIVRAANAEDVARVVRFARETGTELAIRAGGHSNAGHGSTDSGVVLDLRDMTALEIDAKSRTAWAEGGLTAGAVTSQLAEHGFAIPFGDTGSVGIGGLTLGGGVGYLVRRYGMTIDNLLGAEIVTADGELLRVDADDHPALFWAIRGGGGNFGVVTRFRFRLQPLDGIVGGMLVLPATPDTIAGFIAAAEAAPEELSTIANVMSAPPMPFLPEEAHGKVVILAMLAYAGGAEDGERALAPFRALAEPMADMLRPMSYPEMFPPEDPDYHPTAAATTMFLDHVDVNVAETMLRFLKSSNAPMRVAQLRVLGGAMARVPADATAFAHRSSRIMVNLAAFYGPDDRARREAWVADFAAAIDQGDGGAYVNFLADEGPDRVHAAYPPATWDRLASVKAQYDPTNLFRLNQNVPPAA
jgi:FAD/FMN-containing dehydrogenase